MTAKQITRIRIRLFGTQAAAAMACGITPGAWSHYEVGRRPIPETIIKLLACLEDKQSSDL